MLDLRTVEHLHIDCRLSAMLIPYGYFKNKWLLNLQKGDYVQTIDTPEVVIRIIEKTTIPIASPIAQSLSLLIYNKPIEEVFNAMLRNWKYDIQKKNVILIIYERDDSYKERFENGIENRAQIPI